MLIDVCRAASKVSGFPMRKMNANTESQKVLGLDKLGTFIKGNDQGRTQFIQLDTINPMLTASRTLETIQRNSRLLPELSTVFDEDYGH